MFAGNIGRDPGSATRPFVDELFTIAPAPWLASAEFRISYREIASCIDRHDLVKILDRLFMQRFNSKINSSIVKGTIEFAVGGDRFLHYSRTSASLDTSDFTNKLRSSLTNQISSFFTFYTVCPRRPLWLQQHRMRSQLLDQFPMRLQ